MEVYTDMQNFKGFIKYILCICLLGLSCLGVADPVKTQTQPLPIDQAFDLSAALFGNDTVLLTWTIAPKHYLYRERIKFSLDQPQAASVGSIILPPGLTKTDEVIGKYQVYKEKITIPVPIINADPQNTVFTVHYQGCSAEGYCYPPTQRQIAANFKQASVQIQNPEDEKPAVTGSLQEQRYIHLLKDKNIFSLILAFIGIGVLLSFTPCVLPMLPILSGIIAGQTSITTKKAFRLSLVYTLSMALTYAAAGMLIGYIGASIQSFFQQSWVLIIFSLLFVAMALSFFGFYQIKLPAHFEEKIAHFSRGHDGGSYIGVALMGCFATLILSPCVTPALIGILSFIGEKGNPLLGAIALFSLGLGMGLPLLLIGTAGGKLLPKAGAWMNTIRSVFGVLFIAMAILTLSKILPGSMSLTLWACLLIICAIFLGAFSTAKSGWAKAWKGFGLICFTYGILMLTGAAQGNSDPFQPIAMAATSRTSFPSFVIVRNQSQLDQALNQARLQNKPVFLDFYADWCMSCQALDRTTFKNPAVQAELTNFVAIRANITSNNDDIRAMMREFNVVAPPTLLFFNRQGRLIPRFTLVGTVNPPELLNILQASSEN